MSSRQHHHTWRIEIVRECLSGGGNRDGSAQIMVIGDGEGVERWGDVHGVGYMGSNFEGSVGKDLDVGGRQGRVSMG